MSEPAMNAQQFEYKAEMKQLLQLIVHSLYTHPEVFLRELISNASDALNKVRMRMLTDKNITDAGAPLEIRINLDTKKSLFSIEDTGIGMTREDLVNNIGTVAKSGTLEFVRQMKADQKYSGDELIGQFGVGFYSVFMVTDEVVIETRHADEGSKGYRWTSGGESTFAIEEIDRKARGTKISFKLKESAKQFCESFRVEEIVRKYSNFVDFPILLDGKQINKVTALWRMKPEEIKEEDLAEFYKFITDDFEKPLEHLHFSVEGTAVSFKALLFIPQTAPFDLFRVQMDKGIHLYSNKVLIQRDCTDLLPQYLRFIQGVVDTIDLPLNVSRELTQASPVMKKISDILVSKILAFLEEMSQSRPETYGRFFRNFGPLLKYGLHLDFSNRDKIVDLIRFESSLKGKGEWVSLKDYVSRMKLDQKEIYYMSGESREGLEKNPNFEYFRKNSIEVLFFVDTVDAFILPSLTDYDKKPLKDAKKADIEIPQAGEEGKGEEALDKKAARSLLSLFGDVLKEKVEKVVESKRLVDSPLTLVKTKDSMDSQLERMMKAMKQEIPRSKMILEVNLAHPLIRNLSKLYGTDPASPLLEKCILTMYESALLLNGEMSSVEMSDFVKRMSEVLEETTR